MKTISAGIIIRDPVTRSILCCAPSGRFYKKDSDNCWDIPKGMIDPNEFPVDAAVRECWEETGIAIDTSELIDLGTFPYTLSKDLHLFYIEKEVDIKQCHCDSFFEDRFGRMLPEVCDYGKFQLDDNKLFSSLKNTVVQALSSYGLID